MHEVCSGCQRQRIFAKPLPFWVFILNGSVCQPGLLRFCGDALTLPFALLFISASCAFIDRNPPFFAFSSCFHFPKSIYEGNFGCGYLKERRASGLVFCENTTSVYRALFVSSPVFFLPCVLMETARMWAGTSNAIYSVVEWCGMRF